jgi:putative CocE/NonD family hydrolase
MNNDEDSYATRIVDDLPHRVTVVPHRVVRLTDGTEISVKLWLPDVEPGVRLPVILEAIPYRKDDNSLVDDEARHGYVAGHGYVCIRMDLRGSGSSTGVLEDEYSPREQADIVEVIDWASTQPWSSGRVGMTGISWSGFNSLQVAAKRPPALRAIITVCSTDDRYDNDVHYMGGSLLAFYQNLWGTAMHMQNLTPPDPHYLGERWREEWLHRLHHNPVHTSMWTQHQRRDSYWRQGSVREDYGAITIPTLLVGGWGDPYTDAIFRLLDHLPDTSRGIVGPWAHTWPDRPVPGPSIGFLQECVRWWDAWLKDADNGVHADPRLRFYMQDGEPYTTEVRHREGRWFETDAVHELGEPARWALDATAVDGLIDASGPALAGAIVTSPGSSGIGVVSHSSHPLLGSDARHFEPMGGLGDIPAEQTTDDAGSLVFETAPLADDVEVFGQVVLHVRLAVDKPLAFVFARLTDVDEDGRSYLITRANLNLTHRLGHDSEVAAVPVGEFHDYEIALKNVAERIPAGHRVRLSLSTSYWPWIWPSPEPVRITLDAAGSHITVPQLTPTRQRPLVRPWEPAEIARPPHVVSSSVGEPEWTWTVDESTVQRILKAGAETSKRYPHGLNTRSVGSNEWTLHPDDPLSARMIVHRESEFWRDTGWHVTVRLDSEMSCTAESFVVRTTVACFEGDTRIYAHDTVAEVPRDHN